MGYQSLVASSVNSAFKLVADLARDVVLQKVVQGEFDFGSGNYAPTPSTSITVKAVDIGSPEKTSESSNIIKKKIMFSSSLVDDITIYDYVVDSGYTWKIGPIVKDTGFTVVLEVSRSIV